MEGVGRGHQSTCRVGGHVLAIWRDDIHHNFEGLLNKDAMDTTIDFLYLFLCFHFHI